MIDEEIECKFLDIDVQELAGKLHELHAELKFDRLFRRTVFDYPDLRLNQQNAWLRVRDEGDKVTIGFKQRLGASDTDNDSGMREIETVVGDFDRTIAIFEAIGLKPKFYEENRRTMYLLDGVEVCIDEWPLIPPYVEIEGSTWLAVESVSQKLGFNLDAKVICSTMQIYQRYGITELDYQTLTFDKQIKKL